jgi:uroporphyrinogen decarboxylase
MFYLHGYEATLEDLLVAPDRCADLRDIIMAVMMRRVERLSQIPDLDGVTFRDDWGTQQALMISPRLWREFFKPSYARLFEPVRAAGKHVWFHSDGVIDSIIPDLIEIGVQVLNPQVDVMGKERVAELCGGIICIQGDIDRQFALPHGTPEDVRREVRADIDAFGRHNGGYIGRGETAGDTPLENLEAMFEEMVCYGAYPIDG